MKCTFTSADEQYMRRALTLARRGQGYVEPNPMVGCVIVRRGRIVGEGYHRRFGGPHAEVHALRDAGPAARGATAYVTLEPCSHFGKTPPCTQALIEAGIARLIAAHGDPFPAVAGRGFQALEKAGIQVHCGLLAADAAELNVPFLTRVLAHRPYVIAKWAQSQDGKIATRTGASQWITGPEARGYVHRLRARVDAVAVGIETVLADDPRLDARDVSVRRIAQRVVFDSSLRIPLDAHLVASAHAVPTIVLTTHRAVREHARRRARLEGCGVRVIPCRAQRKRVDIRDALMQLGKLDFTNLLVEGGGECLGSFHDAGLIDEAHVFTAPLIIGGRSARASIGGEGVSNMRDALRGRCVHRRMLGDDFLVVLRLQPLP